MADSELAHSLLFPPIQVDSYKIYVGIDLLDNVIAKHISQKLLKSTSKFLLVTDYNLEKYSQRLQTAFARDAPDRTILVYSIPPGEASKSRETKEAVEDFMFTNGYGRDSALLALGGGVVGDLTGFVASTYMRGVPVVQIPTTLLAMVDSSIGGKTGIDTPNGKNLLGTFHQPKSVYIDMQLLTSLPNRQFCNGMAEVIKAGAIQDELLFNIIEYNSDQILSRDLQLLGKIVHRSAEIKANVVLNDERESGMRSILNFGHSIGHAIEAMMQPELLHGECVAIGMIEEAILARGFGYLNGAAIRRLYNCCRAYSLPTEVPHHLSTSSILRYMAIDKKNINGKKELVMLTSIGSVRSDRWTTTVSDEDLIRLLSPSIMMVPGVANGRIDVPGSKSLSNRALLLAALGSGTCRIRGLLHSQDTQVMLESLREFGVSFYWEDRQSVLVMQGSAGNLKLPQNVLYLHNAGTASRFLTTVAALAPAGYVVLDGNARMRERPIADLVDALRIAGIEIEYLKKPGCLPIRVTSGGLKGGDIKLHASVSSQYVSSVLQAAAHATNPVILYLEGQLVSKPFIDMTICLMREFGIKVDEIATNVYRVQNGIYQNPSHLLVEGDASSASYPLSFAAVTGGSVTVTNVGSKSLQGDARFCTLLEKMGCQVEQTETETTVRGTLSLKALNDVNMDLMTDCFMTIAAVAAFADGVTRIKGISNQRVKECDRISATVIGLQSLGISAKELPDGLEIVGLAGDASKAHGAMIDCHDDHRIAMSFAIIGSRVPDVVLNEKRCVDKTYPEFWEHAEKHLGLQCKVPLIKATMKELTASKDTIDNSNLSIWLIGMRGAGKSTFGQHAAKVLGLRFVDLDDVITAEVVNIKAYIETHGWNAFRATEYKHFVLATKQYSHGYVLACGGGVVETLAIRELLVKMPNVILITRHLDDIVDYLSQDSTRPSFDPIATYKRRQQWYLDCSSHEFVVSKGRSDFNIIQDEFVRFIQHVTGRIRTTIGEPSFFLSLTAPDINSIVQQLPVISSGADALELRVDLLANYSEDYVKQQFASIRQYSQLPIIYTVRTKGEGGKYPDDEESYVSLTKLGVRLGAEFIDIEAHWKTPIKQGNSQVISSVHLFHSNGGSKEELAELFTKAAVDGEIVKVVIMAKNQHDAVRLIDVANSLHIRKPVIAIAMGIKGKLSRVLNQFMTPVTHDLLASAAPGQMTVEEIQHARRLLGIMEVRNFYLFGKPITHSPSPLLHNTGFRLLCLPYHYEKLETDDLATLATIIRHSSFYGASVTIPFKEKVASLLDELSDNARAIGAVNTIYRRESDDKIVGTNTDWLGIYRLLQNRAYFRPAQPAAALVLGAGGTARAALYALQQLGYHDCYLLLHNPRTPTRAEKLCAEFGATPLLTLNSCDTNLAVVVSTLPGSSMYEPPSTLFASPSRPIVLEASYIPYETQVTRTALLSGCDIIHGIDMLIAQGQAQFELWTGGRCSPWPAMASVVKQSYMHQHALPASE